MLYTMSEVQVRHKINDHIINGLYIKSIQKVKYNDINYSPSDFIKYHYDVLSIPLNENNNIKYCDVHGRYQCIKK